MARTTTTLRTLAIVLSCAAALALLPGGAAAASTRHAAPSADRKVKHVIVLMEENRSFDHMLGFSGLKGINGLDGTESNPLNTSDPHSPRVTVDDKSAYLGVCDPNHSTPATTSKLFGAAAVKSGNLTREAMSGFVEWERNNPDYCGVVSMFTPQRLPVMTALASEFAVMDNFFCAHPGPTWPNRLFALTATSGGNTETGVWYRNSTSQLFPMRTIYDQVAAATGPEPLTWRNYYNDTVWEMILETVAHNPENTRPLQEFFADAESGDLPAFAWINPRAAMNVTTGIGSNDQHPDHDVAAGEEYIKTVYEALRASPAWNDTLFIVTYDEHGGFYDHVPPPMVGVPRPDDEPSYPDVDFPFDRLGVRIPTLLASPWIPRGTVVSAPPVAQKPTPTSQYDLTSIAATTRKLLAWRGMEQTPLTRRDAWSATFEHALSLAEPRTDCPMHLPDAPPPAPPAAWGNTGADAGAGGATEFDEIGGEAALPINSLQRYIGTVHEHMAATGPLEELSTASGSDDDFAPAGVSRQGHVSEWLQQAYARHSEGMAAAKRHRAAEWEASTQATMIATRAGGTPGWLNTAWTMNKSSTAGVLMPWVTLATKQMSATTRASTAAHAKGDEGVRVPYCLDAGPGFSAGTAVGIAPCGSGNGRSPADPQQRWVWGFEGDATVRPYGNTTLCLTAHRFDHPGPPDGDDNAPVTVEVCSDGGDVRQDMGFYGPAPGATTASGMIVWGAYAVGVVAKV